MARELTIDETLALVGKIERYVETFKDKHHSEWPTIRHMARKFKVTQELVQDIIEMSENMDLIVGLRTGGGYYEHNHRGDWSAEWIGDET